MAVGHGVSSVLRTHISPPNGQELDGLSLGFAADGFLTAVKMALVPLDQMPLLKRNLWVLYSSR